MMNDPFDTGTPKYSTASDIYDALCELTQTEEMCILSEISPDVSYDNQDYYYTEKGCALKDKFEELSEYGDKMWLMDLAIWQLDRSEIHDTIYEALNNSDLEKRIGFKKIFIEKMLYGDKTDYEKIVEAFAEEVRELDYFSNWEMIQAFNRAMAACKKSIVVTPYPNFCHAICKKVQGMRLDEETRLIVECRALLTSYDDFILGLRMNQHLYTTLEKQYGDKILRLQAEYEKKVQWLLQAAKQQGIALELNQNMNMLIDKEAQNNA